jgi:hypothetical protein
LASQINARPERISDGFFGAFLVHGAAGSLGEPLKNKGNFWQPQQQQKINLAGSGYLSF